MDTVEELLGLLRQQTEINTELVRGQQDALIDGNIAKSPGGSTFGQKVSPKLTSTEIRRTTEASNIFIKTFFDMEKKMKPDKKEKTLTNQLYKRADKATERVKTPKEGKGGSSLWDTILSALGLGAAVWPLIKSGVKKLISKFVEKLKGFFFGIAKRLLGFVKNIGSLISGVWKRIVNSRFVKVIGRAIKSAMRGIGRALSRIVGAFKRFFGSIARRLRNLWTSIKGSKAYKSVSKAFKSAGKAIGNFFTGLKNKLASLLKTAVEAAKNLIPEGAKEFIGKGTSAAKSVGKTVAEKAGGWWNIAKNLGSKAWSGVKSTAGAVGEAVVEGGAKAGKLAVQGAKAVGEFALEPAKATVRSAASDAIKGAGGMMKMMGKLAKLPILGPLIEGAFTAYDIKGLKEKYEKGEITLEELQSQSGRRVIQGVSAVGGSALGTFLGAAAGSVIPVAGNVVGGILGAIGGDMLGRFVGGLINDYLLPPKYSKSIGAFVTGTAPPQEEMQDFIIRGNHVYKFSNKDEVLGMKSGGAIDQFLGSQQGENGMGLLVKTANTANLILQGIERNTRELLKVMGGKPNGEITVVNRSTPQIRDSAERPTTSVGNNRAGYASSPYALA